MATVFEDRRLHVNNHPAATIASYLTSLGLVFGSVFDFLNQNALAFGVIFGFITCVINYRAKAAIIKQFSDTGQRRRKTDFIDE